MQSTTHAYLYSNTIEYPFFEYIFTLSLLLLLYRVDIHCRSCSSLYRLQCRYKVNKNDNKEAEIQISWEFRNPVECKFKFLNDRITEEPGKIIVEFT